MMEFDFIIIIILIEHTLHIIDSLYMHDLHAWCMMTLVKASYVGGWWLCDQTD